MSYNLLAVHTHTHTHTHTDVHTHVHAFGRVRLFVTTGTVARKVPLSMGFLRQ